MVGFQRRGSIFSGQKVPWNPLFGQSLIPSTHSQDNSGGCLSRFLIKGQRVRERKRERTWLSKKKPCRRESRRERERERERETERQEEKERERERQEEWQHWREEACRQMVRLPNSKKQFCQCQVLFRRNPIKNSVSVRFYSGETRIRISCQCQCQV